MMYHAQSLARGGFQTFIVGYFESQLPKQLRQLPMAHTVPLRPFSIRPRLIPFIVLAPFKVLWQTYSLFTSLTSRLPIIPQFILVQNPPSLPTLLIVKLVATLCGSRVIIDWHNLGYSILALKFNSEDHPFVRVAKAFERTFGRTAYAHLFVTYAMRDALTRDWDLRGAKVVLHDRPPPHFHRLLPVEAHELFSRITSSFTNIEDFLPTPERGRSTPFTAVGQTPAITTLYSSNGDIQIEFRHDRPALVISSTSWTDDEDFSILLESLSKYEKKAREAQLLQDPVKRLPRILCIVTGKGPNRDKYIQKIASLTKAEKWVWVRCISLWLAAEDYPLLLGAADLGVSLHSSSSALDLPMKIVDMFGCGVPVCALKFECLGELVKDGINGRSFQTSEELVLHFEAILEGFPNAPILSRLQKTLHLSTSKTPTSHNTGWEWGTWDENWDNLVRPLIVTKPVEGVADFLGFDLQKTE